MKVLGSAACGGAYRRATGSFSQNRQLNSVPGADAAWRGLRSLGRVDPEGIESIDAVGASLLARPREAAGQGDFRSCAGFEAVFIG